MAYSSYFDTITSESTFEARFQAENPGPLEDLLDESASHWGRSHLFACRVVRRDAQHNILPVLSQYTAADNLRSQPDQIKLFLEGPDPAFVAESEHSLVRNFNYGISLAQVWAAMAIFLADPARRIVHGQDSSAPQGLQSDGMDIDGPEERYPRRVRNFAGTQPGFVESSGMRIGSSPEGSFSSSQQSSIGHVDPESHALSITTEDDTLRLASCVIRHLLYFAAPQDAPWNLKVVEFRDTKARTTAVTPLHVNQIVAIDDGGLCLRRQEPGKGFVLVNNHVALLEAKTRFHFHYLQDGRPTISDECFGQMVCEALATRLAHARFDSMSCEILDCNV